MKSEFFEILRDLTPSFLRRRAPRFVKNFWLKHKTQVSDEDFVEICYKTFLGRQSDTEGRKNCLEALRQGISRLELIKSIVSSAEYFNVMTRNLFGEINLLNLQQIRPKNYKLSKKCYSDEKILTFCAKNKSDYDWLESMIIKNGYYEMPGVWSLAIDTDKHIIAEIVSRFSPSCCLEIGCSTGSVLKLLNDKDIHAEGVEISHKALAFSYWEIRNRIHFGDILTLNLESKYDFIIGMDIFEHLSPNRLCSYLEHCYSLMCNGGFVFTNVPAFGKDHIFGEVFPVYVEDWVDESKSTGLFSLLHVDEKGWPINGHLIWATAKWWQRSFEAVGFDREVEIEAALHEVYDDYMLRNTPPARKSFFVFSKNVNSPPIREHIINTIKRNQSNYVDL